MSIVFLVRLADGRVRQSSFPPELSDDEMREAARISFTASALETDTKIALPLEYIEADSDTVSYHLKGNGDPHHSNCSDPNCHDRYYRDAVRWDDTIADKCACDMPIARRIHMDKIRVVRNAELAAKDITFMRAVEAGDASAQSTIGTEKQVLRDLPATFDITTDAGTPELLKAKWPTELPARE